jgi:hypothetical protein
MQWRRLGKSLTLPGSEKQKRKHKNRMKGKGNNSLKKEKLISIR